MVSVNRVDDSVDNCDVHARPSRMQKDNAFVSMAAVLGCFFSEQLGYRF